MFWLPGQLATPAGVLSAPRLNPAWVSRGLVLVVRDGLWVTPAGSRAMSPVNSPGRTVGPQGKTTGYGTTDAGNTTARMTGFRLPASPTGRRSYFGTCRVRSLGGGNLGRIFQDASGTGVSVRAGEHALWMFSSNGYNTPALQVADNLLIQNTFYVNATTSFQAINGALWHSYGFSCDFPGGGTPSFSQVRGYVNGIEYVGGGGSVSGSLSAGPWAATGAGFTDMVFGNRPSDSARNFDGQLGILAVFDAQLTAADHQSLHANPAQLLDSGPHTIWTPVVSTVTVYRPGGDVITNNWTATPGGTLASCIDDPTLDRGDYITSPNLSDPATLDWTPPVPAGTWDMVVDGVRLGATGQIRIVCLDAGGSSVGATSWQPLTASATTYTLSVTTSATSTRFRIEVQS